MIVFRQSENEHEIILSRNRILRSQFFRETAKIALPITVIVSAVCGFAMMTLLALLIRSVMKLRNDGNIDNRNAVGVSAKVYLTIPAERKGEGKINVMIQGSFVER